MSAEHLIIGKRDYSTMMAHSSADHLQRLVLQQLTTCGAFLDHPMGHALSLEVSELALAYTANSGGL